MAKGQRVPAEHQMTVDERTGIRIRQVTSGPAIHHQPFFLIPAYDDAMRRLVMASHRTGSPQIWVEERETGSLVQLTDREGLAEWSIHPAHDGQYVYFTAGMGAWRVHTETCREEQLLDLRELTGQVPASPAVGTTALSRCDRWWAIRFVAGGEGWLAILDTASGRWQVALRRDVISHLQFCPDDANLLFYAGPLTDRVWAIHRDGSGNRRLYQRQPEEWITHESWIPGTRELAFVDWPHGVRCVQVDTGQERRVTSVNAWHAICSRDGRMMVADTNFPDIGLQLFNARDGRGEPLTLCYPESSSIGEHWKGPFPYANGPIKTYAPQHTHPHPSFSPDGKIVVFTSDRTGCAQVYEAELPDHLIERILQ